MKLVQNDKKVINIQNFTSTNIEMLQFVVFFKRFQIILTLEAQETCIFQGHLRLWFFLSQMFDGYDLILMMNDKSLLFQEMNI